MYTDLLKRHRDEVESQDQHAMEKRHQEETVACSFDAARVWAAKFITDETRYQVRYIRLIVVSYSYRVLFKTATV